MREYKITKCDLGWNILKKREKDGFISLRFLDGKGKWTLNKSYARVFYTKEDALSNLTVIKAKDAKSN